MHELTCQQLVELVTEYLEDTMTSEARAEFAAHLEECPACADYVAQLRHTIGALGVLADAAPAQPSTELLDLFRTWRGQK
jgi:anti-sigma factor RsiW